MQFKISKSNSPARNYLLFLFSLIKNIGSALKWYAKKISINCFTYVRNAALTHFYLLKEALIITA